jgi:hypothetical protein
VSNGAEALVSPILVRPVREQLEHDRIIRLLQAKCRRRFEVGINPGSEQNAAVGTDGAPIYPDLVLHSQERGHRLQAVVEVETGESVNHLEALAEWAHLSRLRAAFHLYVPAGMVDVARRLCQDNQISVDEIWSYHTFGDEVRFTNVHRTREPIAPAPRPHPPAAARPVRTAAATRRKAAAPPAIKRPARTAKTAAGLKAAKKPAPAQKRK